MVKPDCLTVMRVPRSTVGLKRWRYLGSVHNLDWMTPRESEELNDEIGNAAQYLVITRGGFPHSGTADRRQHMERPTLSNRLAPHSEPTTAGAPADLDVSRYESSRQLRALAGPA